MPGNKRKHQSAQPKLGSNVQVGTMSDQYFDDLAMTGMCGQHKGRLTVAIAGIHICPPPKKIKDDLEVPTFDRVLPGGIHQLKDTDSVFMLGRMVFFTRHVDGISFNLSLPATRLILPRKPFLTEQKISSGASV